ncbi:hypothetical protein Sgly_3325 [Syntrophobotulus glycolicus DSM 8271]|uniref:Lipoprotein n=1 Tax=Syntrophobotulus glycolicus (strain DSM 8271 / FlGlyR) TaxID=645991 RepID=F0T2V1_SYNGF|nr:hypothetical protein [Syntrophobotulus glycolicus]ADY57588.1 hypothetical protein Sgly_3325 [Syntrophobotulus glycolicus DSM 8271]
MSQWYKSCKKQGLGQRVRLILMVMSLLSLFTLSGCNSLEDAVEKAKPYIPEGYTMLHIEQVSENSAIVFYSYQDELSAGMFIKNTFGWDWIGSGVGKLITYPEGLQWRYADLGNKQHGQYSLYYGKVNNPDISAITVKTINGNISYGKVVNTEQLKMWYAFVDEPQVPSVSAVITGSAADGRVLYRFSQSN